MAQIIRQLYAVAAVGRVAEPLPLRDTAWTRWRACERKMAYRSQWGALLAAAAWERRGDDALHAYRCVWGDHWHVGHAPRPLPDAAGSSAAR